MILWQSTIGWERDFVVKELFRGRHKVETSEPAQLRTKNSPKYRGALEGGPRVRRGGATERHSAHVR